MSNKLCYIDKANLINKKSKLQQQFKIYSHTLLRI